MIKYSMFPNVYFEGSKHKYKLNILSKLLTYHCYTQEEQHVQATSLVQSVISVAGVVDNPHVGIVPVNPLVLRSMEVSRMSCTILVFTPRSPVKRLSDRSKLVNDRSSNRASGREPLNLLPVSAKLVSKSLVGRVDGMVELIA